MALAHQEMMLVVAGPCTRHPRRLIPHALALLSDSDVTAMELKNICTSHKSEVYIVGVKREEAIRISHLLIQELKLERGR